MPSPKSKLGQFTHLCEFVVGVLLGSRAAIWSPRRFEIASSKCELGHFLQTFIKSAPFCFQFFLNGECVFTGPVAGKSPLCTLRARKYIRPHPTLLWAIIASGKRISARTSVARGSYSCTIILQTRVLLRILCACLYKICVCYTLTIISQKTTI